MNCPSCDKGTLKPVWLEPQLPAYGCNQCEGVLVPLIAYRAWIETNPAVETSVESGELVSEETSHAMACTRCEGLMTKYHFAADVDRRLDLCPRCEDVWLDAGEWDYLKERRIHGELPNIFSEPWQHALHRERRKEWSRRHWERRLGAQFERSHTFKTWLSKQPNRHDIVAYLADPEGRG